MPFDPRVLALLGLESPEEQMPQRPQFDPDVTAMIERNQMVIDRRKSELRERFGWDLSAPLLGTREAASERAMREVTDPGEREWLAEEVAKIAKAQAFAREKEYGEAGLPGRFALRSQQVGGAFADAGTSMVGAAHDFREWLQGRGRSIEEVKFKRKLLAAKQAADPSLGEDAPLSLRAAAGASGMAPDLSAGLLAGSLGGPWAMFGYWTARLFPERNEDYLEQGLNPGAAATAGTVTAAAESAIELINIDPTGVSKGVIAQPAKGVLRRGITEAIKKYGGKRLVAITQKSPAVRMAIGQALDALERTGTEIVEEGMQRGVRDLGLYLTALADEDIEGPVFTDIAPAMWEEMRTAAPGIMALGGGAGAGMAIGEATAARTETIRKEIKQYAAEGKTPSRKTRREWGLPEEGWESRKQRKDGVKRLAAEIEAEERVGVHARSLVESDQAAQEAAVTVEANKVQEIADPVEAAPDAAEPAVKAAGATGGQASQAAASYALQVGEAKEADVKLAELADPGVREAASAMRLKADEAKAIAKDVVSLISPAHVTEVARKTGHLLRRKGAQAAQQTQAARARMGKLEFQFLAMPPEARLQFIDRMEEGKQQATPALDAAAKVLREELDGARDRVRKIGKLNEYYDNYFPHIWKHSADKDAVLATMGGKTFRVSGFLRKRTIPTIRAGIEAGLELVTDNPVDLAMARIQQMNEYVAKTQALQVMKNTGISKFVPAAVDKSFLPPGYEFVNDPAFLVQASADVTVEEAYDELLREQLESVAHAIDVSHERVAKLPEGRWGESVTKGAKVRTRFAGPMSVLAHEIGHQIGDKYGLIEHIEQSHPEAKNELVALAQLRYEGRIPDMTYQQYVEEVDEKEAVILEAWLAAPEKMAQIAPNVTEAWKDFLENNEQVRPLLVLNRSLVIGSSEVTIEQPGVHVLGRYALPREVATMVNNHLSPGLRRNQNLAIKSGYKLARTIGNAMNQASLSMSFFHGLNVMTDAVASQHALGMQQVARGKVDMGIGNILGAITLVQPGFKALRKGRELVHAMNQDMSTIKNPALRATLETIITAGGRSFMDQQYHNHSAKALVQSIRDMRYGSVLEKASASVMMPARMVFAALEASAWPVMQYMVPRLKLGVFYYQAEDIYRRTEAEGLSDFQMTEQLSQAWDSVDNRMGQLGYDNLFWNQYLKDASMLAVRSVGWNLGSIREFGGGIMDIGTFRQRMERGDQFLSRKTAYFAGAAVTYAQLGAIIMYLMSGEWPKLLKDYFFPRTGRTNPDGSDERISLPTYAKDWVAWSTDPVKTIKHKMHPLWGTISDMLSNEDYFGTEIRNADDPWMAQLIDTVQRGAESFLPFSIRNFERMREAEEPIGIAVPLAALGISPAPGYITRTKAQKLATHYLKERMPAGSRTADEAAASKHRKNLLKRMRAGEEMTRAEEGEGLSTRKWTMLRKESKMTPFQAMYNRLALDEALNVYVVSNEEEREQVTSILRRKYRNAKERTDDERRLYRELFPK